LAGSGATVVVAAIRAPPVKTSPKYLRRLAPVFLVDVDVDADVDDGGPTDSESATSIFKNTMTKEKAATKKWIDLILQACRLLLFPRVECESGTIGSARPFRLSDCPTFVVVVTFVAMIVQVTSALQRRANCEDVSLGLLVTFRILVTNARLQGLLLLISVLYPVRSRASTTTLDLQATEIIYMTYDGNWQLE
jgi:hypothetical protein